MAMPFRALKHTHCPANRGCRSAEQLQYTHRARGARGIPPKPSRTCSAAFENRWVLSGPAMEGECTGRQVKAEGAVLPTVHRGCGALHIALSRDAGASLPHPRAPAGPHCLRAAAWQQQKDAFGRRAAACPRRTYTVRAGAACVWDHARRGMHGDVGEVQRGQREVARLVHCAPAVCTVGERVCRTNPEGEETMPSMTLTSEYPREYVDPRIALEGQGPQRRPQKRVDRRLEAVAKAVGGGYCRLQMRLRLALAVREAVAGHRLGARAVGAVPLPLPMHPWWTPPLRSH